MIISLLIIFTVKLQFRHYMRVSSGIINSMFHLHFKTNSAIYIMLCWTISKHGLVQEMIVPGKWLQIAL